MTRRLIDPRCILKSLHFYRVAVTKNVELKLDEVNRRPKVEHITIYPYYPFLLQRKKERNVAVQNNTAEVTMKLYLFSNSPNFLLTTIADKKINGLLVYTLYKQLNF